MKHVAAFLLFLLATTPRATADDGAVPPLPVTVAGVRDCRVDLNGTWEFSMTPGDSFWTDARPSSRWQAITVPGECQMQGFMIEHDKEYAYRTSITVPRDMRGQRIALRFNGVYSRARLWVNGRSVRSHDGGFTTWEGDITPFVTPGEKTLIVVGITDRSDEISYASGYAHHPIGGILRGVELVARPAVHCTRLEIATHRIAGTSDARIDITHALSLPQGASITFVLTDPSGKPIRLPNGGSVAASRGGTIGFPVTAPQWWNAEHPLVYTLEARVILRGQTVETIRERFGFREVRVEGTQLLVNGRAVKLRGACRHDIHPTRGRSTTPEQDLQDVLLAKEANFNFIRTSHYPPSAEFLEYCDQYGIYVEDESAVCFVSTHRSGPYQANGGSQNDPAFTGRYIGQLTEMVSRDRNHPAVIIWSLGNESTYGTNFQRSYDTVRALDRTRPIIFSYAHTVPDSMHCYDIISSHYPSWDRCLHPSKADSAQRLPVVGDEWMHVPCYCVQDLRDDPGIRDAWGESMQRAWEHNFGSPYSIGGAIWGMIDEIFPLPDTSVGYGPWGIVDIWRRKKPEFWHTRKAYSPIHVGLPDASTIMPERDMLLPVANRFDHTDLADILITCESNGRVITLPSPSVAPHDSGAFTVPAQMTGHGPITLRFTDRWGRLIDEEVMQSPPVRTTATPIAHDLTVDRAANTLLVRGDGFDVTIDRSTGAIASASVGGERIIDAGPFLRVVKRGTPLNWDVDTTYDIAGAFCRVDSVAIEVTPAKVVVTSRGMTDSLAATIIMTITARGEIVTTYRITDPPAQCQEAGIRFRLTPLPDRVQWERRALWSSYPDDHIGRPVGEAPIFAPHAEQESPHRRPDRSWGMDTKDEFLLPGYRGLPVPADFRSRKENIMRYALTNRRTGKGVEVTADGDCAARTAVLPDGMMDLLLDNAWTYLNMNWGNYERPAPLARPYTNTVTIRLLR